MLRSLVQRVYWPLGLAAALGLVFVVSSAEAVNKNPGDPFSVGIVNSIDQPTELSGNSRTYSLRVFNTAPYSRAIQALSVGVGDGESTVGVYGGGTDIGVNGNTNSGAGVRGAAFRGTAWRA